LPLLSLDELDDRETGARLPPRFFDVDDESVLLLLSPLALEEERDAEVEGVDFFLSESLDRPDLVPLADRSLIFPSSFFDDLLLEALLSFAFTFFGSPFIFSAAPDRPPPKDLDDDVLSSEEDDLPDRIELLLRWLVLERLDLEGRLLALELSLVLLVSRLIDSPPHRFPPADDELLAIRLALPLLSILDSCDDLTEPRLDERVLFLSSCCVAAVPVVALELLLRLSNRAPLVGVLEREDGRLDTEEEDVGDFTSRLDREASRDREESRFPVVDLDSDRDLALDLTDCESFPSRCDLDSDRRFDSGRLLDSDRPFDPDRLLLALKDLTDRASPSVLDLDLDPDRDFPLDDLIDRPAFPPRFPSERFSPMNLPSSHFPSLLFKLASS